MEAMKGFSRQSGTLICHFTFKPNHSKMQRYFWLQVFEHTLTLSIIPEIKVVSFILVTGAWKNESN